MAIWDDLYNSLPRQGYNPGYGAREFQGLKSRLVDRISVDHIFGQDEVDSGFTGGKHKEGGARVCVQDGLETASPRADYRINALTSLDEGRINVDLTERGTALKNKDVVGTSDEATRYSIISVIADFGDVAVEVVPIFDYDRLVNLSFDQTIAGVKIFSDTIEIEDVAVANWQLTSDSDTYDAVVAPVTIQNPLPMGQIRTAITGAKEHNLFDATDAYNTTETVVGVDYTFQTISVQNVYAKNVYGAVWG